MIEIIRKITNRLVKLFVSKVAYAKHIGVTVGNDCLFYSANFGSEPYLVTIGDRVQIAGNVHFWTHGGVWPLRNDNPKFDYFGKIMVGNNVYIGSHSAILPGVTIGDNVIVGGKTVVTKSVPANSIVVGNPGRVVGNITSFKHKMTPYNVDSYGLSHIAKKRLILGLAEEKFLKK